MMTKENQAMAKLDETAEQARAATVEDILIDLRHALNNPAANNITEADMAGIRVAIEIIESNY
jgi:hypothetical protein